MGRVMVALLGVGLAGCVSTQEMPLAPNWFVLKLRAPLRVKRPRKHEAGR